jgi:hypothetical protein
MADQLVVKLAVWMAGNWVARKVDYWEYQSVGGRAALKVVMSVDTKVASTE